MPSQIDVAIIPSMKKAAKDQAAAEPAKKSGTGGKAKTSTTAALVAKKSSKDDGPEHAALPQMETPAEAGDGEGGAELARAEPRPVRAEALDALVHEIVRLQTASAFAFALHVGQLVVERLFDGDIDEVQRRGPKDKSFMRLAEHRDLPIGRTMLSNAVSVYCLVRRIGQLEVVQTSELPAYSHFVAVLPAPVEEQERLLAETAANGWTVEQLKSRLKELKAPRRGGRRRHSEIEKAVGAVEAALRKLDEVLGSKKAPQPRDHDVLKALAKGLTRVAADLRSAVASK